MMTEPGSPNLELREQLADTIFENERLKEEIKTLKGTIEKAYDYIKKLRLAAVLQNM